MTSSTFSQADVSTYISKEDLENFMGSKKALVVGAVNTKYSHCTIDTYNDEDGDRIVVRGPDNIDVCIVFKNSVCAYWFVEYPNKYLNDVVKYLDRTCIKKDESRLMINYYYYTSSETIAILLAKDNDSFTVNMGIVVYNKK